MNDTMRLLFKISLAIFMVGSLLEIGLRLNLADALRGLRSGRFVGLASHFLDELTGEVHLSQYDAVASINPDLARRTREAERAPATGGKA
jgi:hypothetical protein